MADETYKQAPLNAGSRGLARDPADWYEQQEARTCKGCAHEITVPVAGHETMACGKNRRYGRRCKLYDEREPASRR